MRTILLSLPCLLLAMPAASFAQTPGAPARTAVASTPEQDASIRAGVALNDEGKFDEAIARYQEVLKASPDNMTALYELAYSYGEKKDYAKSIDAATRGTAYRSDLLPMFYDLIASALDASGEPQKAIDAYKRGIQVVPSAAMLYHNMAMTYLDSLKNPDEARRALKQGADADPTEPAIHIMLGQVFHDGGYNTPAFFALATYLVLEPAGGRSLQAYGNWRAILKGGVEAPLPGIETGVDSAMRTPPKRPGQIDEGDFSDLDGQFASGARTFLADLDGGKTEIQALVGQVDRLLLYLEGRGLGRDRTTFTAVHYLPYFRELKEKNFVEPFVYWISQRTPVQGVREWLNANQARVQEFLAWTRAYPWPRS